MLLSTDTDQPDIIQQHISLSRNLKDIFITLHEMQESEMKELTELEVMECKEVVEVRNAVL